MTKLTPSNDPLLRTLAAAVRHARQMEAEAAAERAQLEKALKLARGTGDITEKAQEVVRAAAVPAKRTLADQIESLLRDNGLVYESAIAGKLGVSATKVTDEMRRLAREHKIYNIGTEQHPRWCWVIGDTSSPAELNEQVYRLTSAVPLTFEQLTAATGARRGRVSGAIVAMQRNPKIAKRIENLGNGRVFVWFVRPAKH